MIQRPKPQLVDQRLNRCGQKVEDSVTRLFISANNLVTLNTNQPTYFSISRNTETALNLSLCSPLLGTWFDWSIDSVIYDSDHYPILLHFTFQEDGTRSFIPRWKLGKAQIGKKNPNYVKLCGGSLMMIQNSQYTMLPKPYHRLQRTAFI